MAVVRTSNERLVAQPVPPKRAAAAGRAGEELSETVGAEKSLFSVQHSLHHSEIEIWRPQMSFSNLAALRGFSAQLEDEVHDNTVRSIQHFLTYGDAAPFKRGAKLFRSLGLDCKSIYETAISRIPAVQYQHIQALSKHSRAFGIALHAAITGRSVIP